MLPARRGWSRCDFCQNPSRRAKNSKSHLTPQLGLGWNGLFHDFSFILWSLTSRLEAPPNLDYLTHFTDAEAGPVIFWEGAQASAFLWYLGLCASLFAEYVADMCAPKQAAGCQLCLFLTHTVSPVSLHRLFCFSFCRRPLAAWQLSRAWCFRRSEFSPPPPPPPVSEWLTQLCVNTAAQASTALNNN